MGKIDFGKELDVKSEYYLTLEEFEDLLLYNLEDYFFNNKFKGNSTFVWIPALGIDFCVKTQYKLDLHDLFNIPQISFDTNGCLYSNNQESAYVSTEFFEKCFIERTLDVYDALFRLYMPKVLFARNKLKEKFNDAELPKLDPEDIKKIDPSKIKIREGFDFVTTYKRLVEIRRLNQNLTDGLIGLGTIFDNKDAIIKLRKIQMGAEIQTSLEHVIDSFIDEELSENQFDFYKEIFTQSKDYQDLEAEHDRLFRHGNYVKPIILEDYGSEWSYYDSNAKYDEGTDEEREKWRQEFDKVSKLYKDISHVILKKSKYYPLSVIKDRVINDLKVKIYAYDYSRFKGARYNYYINELGLDVIPVFAHPADKYKHARWLSREPREYFDVEPSDYDYLYGNLPEEYEVTPFGDDIGGSSRK